MSNERKQRQTRSLPQRFETREAEGGALYIEGYFAVFDSPYELWEGAVEIVKPGAFAGCLSQDVRALINHDTTLVLGRTKSGTDLTAATGSYATVVELDAAGKVVKAGSVVVASAP